MHEVMKHYSVYTDNMESLILKHACGWQTEWSVTATLRDINDAMHLHIVAGCAK